MGVAVEAIAAVMPPTGRGGADNSPLTAQAFDQALAAAEGAPQVGAADATSNPITGLLSSFEQLNTEAGSLHASAVAAETAAHDLTPGEMIMLTMRCNEFLFHCELTTNVASRSSDGLQQLFREQG